MNLHTPTRIALCLPHRGLMVLAALAAPSHLTAQPPCTPGWAQAFWATDLYDNASAALRCLQPHDDGSGPALFVGGASELLTSLGFGLPSPDVARWDGGAWHPVGPAPVAPGGLAPGQAWAMTVFDDGSGPALHASVAWSSPFQAAVFKWNGSVWTQLGGSFLGSPPRVYALHVFDDGSGPALYAGGQFTTVGGVGAMNIARWNGTAWQALGSGSSAAVRSVVGFDDGTGSRLHAAGNFGGAGVARWSGGAWTALAGLAGAPDALAVCDHGGGPVLYAGGSFTLGGTTTAAVARWTGSAWSTLGAGVSGWPTPSALRVTALGVFDAGTGPELIAGGRFDLAGGLPSRMVARWDGTNWASMAPGLDPSPTSTDLTGPMAFATFDAGFGPALYVAGQFARAVATGDGDIAAFACLPPGTLTTNTRLGTACNSLTLSPRSRPVIGTPALNWELRVNNILPTTVFGISIFGTSDPGILNLQALGLPNCELRASLDLLAGPWLPSGTTYTYSATIPNSAALVGFELFTQAATWNVPPLNAFGAFTSHGVKVRLGDL